MLGHLDAAITELANSTFEPIDGGAVRRLLHGERLLGPRPIDQADPPPAYWRFAHVALPALLRRVERVVADPRSRLGSSAE